MFYKLNFCYVIVYEMGFVTEQTLIKILHAIYLYLVVQVQRTSAGSFLMKFKKIIWMTYD